MGQQAALRAQGWHCALCPALQGKQDRHQGYHSQRGDRERRNLENLGQMGKEAGRISVGRLHGEVFSFSLGGEISVVDLSMLKPGGFKGFPT